MQVLNKRADFLKKKLVPNLWPTTIGFAEFAVVSLLGAVISRIRIKINPAMKIKMIIVVTICYFCLII